MKHRHLKTQCMDVDLQPIMQQYQVPIEHLQGKGKTCHVLQGKKKRTVQAFVTCGSCVILALTEISLIKYLVSINSDSASIY